MANISFDPSQVSHNQSTELNFDFFKNNDDLIPHSLDGQKNEVTKILSDWEKKLIEAGQFNDTIKAAFERIEKNIGEKIMSAKELFFEVALHKIITTIPSKLMETVKTNN